MKVEYKGHKILRGLDGVDSHWRKWTEPRPVGLCLKHHYQTSDSECCEYAKERGKNERRGLHGESTDVCGV